tara:strand:- start:1239 stop:1808 length:570 start_codon:yes stop_codon:yes gene_type:complete
MVLPAQSYDYLQNLQDSLRTNYQQGKTGNLNLPGMGLDVLGAGAQTLGAYDRAVTPFAESAVKNLRGLAPKTLGPDVSRFARMAGNPRMLGAFKALPALAGLGAVTSAGDILLNNTGVNDAGQDAAGMGLGAGIGFMLGGPPGAVIGAGIGKPVIDLTQEAGKMIFGSDEERELKKALELLQQQQRGMA